MSILKSIFANSGSGYFAFSAKIALTQTVTLTEGKDYLACRGKIATSFRKRPAIESLTKHSRAMQNDSQLYKTYLHKSATLAILISEL